MWQYLNPSNEKFERIVKPGSYVDKTGLIKYTNGQIGKEKRFLLSCRPRGFGKTFAANMLASYYSKGCDQRELFKGLGIEKDPSFEKHLTNMT